MNRPMDVEQILGEFLAPEADQLPERVFEAAFTEIQAIPQRRTLRLPRWLALRPAKARLAAVIALVAFAGLGAALFMTGHDQLPTTGPSESPEASPGESLLGPEGPLNTLGWQAYTSERYGFEILRPPDWVEHPSDHVYRFPDDAELDDQSAAGAERFFDTSAVGPDLLVSAWSVAIPGEMTPESFADGYCRLTTSPCSNMSAQAKVIEMDDGHRGSIVPFEPNTQAFFFEGERVYIVAVWAPEDDPRVAPFGGARRLLEGFVSTMSLLSEGPASEDPPPALDATFVSPVHGYAIDYPSSWTPSAAAVPWDARLAELNETNADILVNNEIGIVRIASTPLEAEVDVDAWIGQWLTEATSPCAPPRATLAEIVIDGQPGRIRTSCGAVEATVVAGGRVYMFTMDDESPTPGVSARAVFAAMMATVRLRPETAEPIPGPSAPAVFEAWTPYISGIYTYEAAYPTDWTVEHLASRAFDTATDQFGPASPAMDTFTNPGGTIRVSHWQATHPADINPGGQPEQLLAWIEDLCVAVGDEQCTGIADRAIPLCRCTADPTEAEFLVPFRDHVMAFFIGTPDDTINIVTIWLGEDDPAAAQYGGARKVLYAFLEQRGVTRRH